MKLFQSNRTFEDLIQHMYNCGYSNHYIDRIKREQNWLKKYQQTYDITSWLEAFQVRTNSTNSASMKEQYSALYNLIRCYILYENLSFRRQKPLVRRGAYTHLNDYYKKLLDTYLIASKERGLKQGTTRASISACSCFLLAMQEAGHVALDTINELEVLSYFLGKNGENPMSKSSRINITSVFATQLNSYTIEARRILSYLPVLRKKRKTIQYLTKEEISAIRNILTQDNSDISLRNKAIGSLLLFTGMRSGDIAGITFQNIDWENEEILIVQKKTGNTLILPLRCIVGNALYEYIIHERPYSDDEHIFLCEPVPHNSISSGTIGNVATKIYDAVSIRQGDADAKGAHLFRHNLATSFAEQGISRPVISSILGHVDPDSLDEYLFADIKHLRECSLHIEDYPVREEVFLI